MVNTRQLVEIAGFVAANLPIASAAGRLGTEDGLQRGWMAVRGLQRGWLVDLTERDAAAAGGVARVEHSPESSAGSSENSLEIRFAARRFAVAKPLVAVSSASGLPGGSTAAIVAGSVNSGVFWADGAGEACVAEPAIRAWCAALYYLADVGGNKAAGQVAEHLSVSQNHVRRKVLQRLSKETERGTIHAPLDRLRRVGERWADLFAGALCHPRMPDGLAIDNDRAEELSAKLRGTSRLRRAAWELHMAGLRTVYPAFPWATPTRQRLATGLAEALLGLLPPDMFTSDGVPAPTWWAGLKPQPR